MTDQEVCEAIAFVRQFRSSAAPSEATKIRVAEFLRFADEYGISFVRAADLAMAIADSGTRISFRHVWPLANVHSTGAPGSLTTLLSPILVAASGFYVPQLSIRGGVSGAIDSLATIPGYDNGLSPKNLTQALKKTRLAHVGHSKADYAFADRALWSLRKDTNTKAVPSLIAASLLGKMLSMGVRHGVVDVRVGPSGNAGEEVHTAFETAYAIVSTAALLGMRVTCVLSDAKTLQWKNVGRIEVVRSLRQILSDPQQYASDVHIQLCILVAACACHAALPLKSLVAWKKEVDYAFWTGKAKPIFMDSITAHGAGPESFVELECVAAKRYRIQLDLIGKNYSPDLKKLSYSIKSLRQKVGVTEGDQIGLVVNEGDHAATVFVPPGHKFLERDTCEAFMDALTNNEGVEPISPQILLYNGQILSDFGNK